MALISGRKTWVWPEHDMFYVRFPTQTLHVTNSARNSPPAVNIPARVRKSTYGQYVDTLSFLTTFMIVKALPSVRKTPMTHVSCSLHWCQMTLHIVNFQI